MSGETVAAASGVRPSRRAASSTAYRRGAPVSPPADLLKLDANEGPLGLRAHTALAIESITTAAMREYPDVGNLEDRLCRGLGASPGQLLVTAGGDDALARIAQAVIDPGDHAIATTPTFEMIPRYVRLAGGELSEVTWFNGDFPVDEVVRGITPSTRAIFVVTPNNPTGSVASARDLEILSRAAPSALLVVDLAYTEFADEDLSGAALALPNAVAVRTFSKAWGLAGLRVGYVIGPEHVMSWLRSVGQPYAVAAPSAAVAAWAIDNLASEVARGVEQVRSERATLTGIFRARGMEVLDSQANFILVRSPRSVEVASHLEKAGIVARLFRNRPNLDNCLRLTCPGEPAAFDRVIRALETLP